MARPFEGMSVANPRGGEGSEKDKTCDEKSGIRERLVEPCLENLAALSSDTHVNGMRSHPFVGPDTKNIILRGVLQHCRARIQKILLRSRTQNASRHITRRRSVDDDLHSGTYHLHCKSFTPWQKIAGELPKHLELERDQDDAAKGPVLARDPTAQYDNRLARGLASEDTADMKLRAAALVDLKIFSICYV